MVPTVPVEALYFGVRRVFVGRPPVEILFVEWVVSLENRIGVFHRFGATAAMWVLPGPLLRVHIVFDVLDVLAALEQQHAETFFAELLRCPAPRDAGAYDNRVERRALHEFLPVTDGVPRQRKTL